MVDVKRVAARGLPTLHEPVVEGRMRAPLGGAWRARKTAAGCRIEVVNTSRAGTNFIVCSTEKDDDGGTDGLNRRGRRGRTDDDGRMMGHFFGPSGICGDTGRKVIQENKKTGNERTIHRGRTLISSRGGFVMHGTRILFLFFPMIGFVCRAIVDPGS